MPRKGLQLLCLVINRDIPPINPLEWPPTRSLYDCASVSMVTRRLVSIPRYCNVSLVGACCRASYIQCPWLICSLPRGMSSEGMARTPPDGIAVFSPPAINVFLATRSQASACISRKIARTRSCKKLGSHRKPGMVSAAPSLNPDKE